ncbi:hypothetical protein [Marmoricola sp. OAE513]|uniref:hypothetical protein n=1 Tax=Marmoricola sp. OAE513 TaxID=2817894 RepID=UPI001AE486A4
MNERQLEVLRWVGDGSHPRDWPDESYKTTARALENRGLVTVSKRTGLWAATITEAGQHYLSHGDYPVVEEATENKPAPERRTRRRRTPPQPKASSGLPPAPTPDPNIQHAESVIEKVLEGGGQADLGKVEFDPHKVLAVAGLASNKPHDKILRFSPYGGWAERKQVAYFDDDMTLRVEREDIAAPERLTKPHPAAGVYKADPDQHMVTKESLSRATRLLHALATEATRRGHTVSSRKLKGLDAGAFRTAIGNGQLEVTVGDFTYGILIAEKPGKGSKRQDIRYRYPYEPPRKTQPMWREIRQNTFVPTGQLSITIVAKGSNRDGRPLIFNDGARKALDQRLGEVLWEMEVRALEDARDARRAEAAAAAKQRRWEAAMEEAKRLLVESHRGDVLDRQTKAWRKANERREYVAAMTATVGAMAAGEDRDRAQAWLDWCTDSIGPADPLQGTLKVPTSPEPNAQNLQPFLNGWSPYGPDGYGRR